MLQHSRFIFPASQIIIERDNGQRKKGLLLIRNLCAPFLRPQKKKNKLRKQRNKPKILNSRKMRANLIIWKRTAEVCGKSGCERNETLGFPLENERGEQKFHLCPNPRKKLRNFIVKSC